MDFEERSRQWAKQYVKREDEIKVWAYCYEMGMRRGLEEAADIAKQHSDMVSWATKHYAGGVYEEIISHLIEHPTAQEKE